MSNIISQSAAAKIANVSRQMICKIKKTGTYRFFTEDGKVNVDHPDWKSYLHERGSSGNNQLKNNKQKVDIEQVNKIEENGEINDDMEEVEPETTGKETQRQKNYFTGGIDPSDPRFTPENIADIKRLAEINKIALEMQVRSSELIEKRIVLDYVQTISRTIDAFFVSFPRRYSERICQMTDSVGMEKKIEELLQKPIQEGIREVKRECEKVRDIKYDG